MKVYIYLFLVLVAANVALQQAYSQDNASGESIRKIRTHYYGVQEALKGLEKRVLYDSIQVYLKEQIPVLISLQRNEDSYSEFYFDGAASGLNFIFTEEAGMENRYYFSNAVENSFSIDYKIPTLIRWIDEKKVYHTIDDPEFVERGILLAEEAVLLHHCVIQALQFGEPIVQKIERMVGEVEKYADSVDILDLKVVNEMEEEYVAKEAETEQIPPPPEYPVEDPSERDPCYGEELKYLTYGSNLLLRKDSKGGCDMGCAVADGYENREYFNADQQPVYSESSGFGYYFGFINLFYNLNSERTFNTVQEYYKNGKLFYKITTKGVGEHIFHISTEFDSSVVD